MTLSVADNVLRCLKKFGATAAVRPVPAPALWANRPYRKPLIGRGSEQAHPARVAPDARRPTG